MSDDVKVRLARQNLQSLQASLATTANKDEVRRRIAATKDRIRSLGGTA